MDNMPSQYYMEERSVQVYRAWLIVLLLAWSPSRWLDAEGEFCYTRGRAQPAPKKAQSISSDNVGEDNSLPPSKLFNLWILVFDHDVAVDISDKKTLVPTSRWFALSQVAASIRPWHQLAPGHWQCSCCHHRCRRYSFHYHHLESTIDYSWGVPYVPPLFPMLENTFPKGRSLTSALVDLLELTT